MATTLKSELNENLILLAARIVREYYFPGEKKHSPDWVLMLAIRDLLLSQPEIAPEELFDVLIKESKLKMRGDLSRYLVKSLAAEFRHSETETFTGSRRFSFARLSAMASLLIPAGQGVSKTKLNQLFFYSDFTNFLIYGRSISGAKYLRGRSGPVLNECEELLKALEFAGVVRRRAGGNRRIVRTSPERPALGNLSFLELVTTYWVNANFGLMTTAELMNYSHREGVYRYTRQDGFIAYEYAQLLQTLPERVIS